MADRVSDAAQIDHSDADVTYMCVRIESPARRARRVATRDLGRHTPPVVKVKAPAADGMDIFGSVCAVEFFPAYRALSFRSLTGKHPRHLTRRGGFHHRECPGSPRTWPHTTWPGPFASSRSLLGNPNKKAGRRR